MMKLVGGTDVERSLTALYESAWRKAAYGKVTRNTQGTSVAWLMLRAAGHVARWDNTDPRYLALFDDLNRRAGGDIRDGKPWCSWTEPPPSAEELITAGLVVQEADFRASMPVYVSPEEKKAIPMEEQAEVKDPTVRARYNHMKARRYGFNTAPRALVKYAKKLGLDPRSFLIIQTISNAKPGKALEQKWIAERSLCERQTVNKVIGQLQNRGLLLVTKGRGKFAASTYDLTPLWERLDEIDRKAQEDEAG